MSARGQTQRPAARTSRRAGVRRARTRSAAASGSAAELEETRAPRQITLRGIVLLVMILVAFVVLAPTFRAYVTQQEQLREVNADLASSQAQAEALAAELEQWQDDDYVRAQARERFNYVEPGETSYRVVDPETVVGEDPIADLTAQAQQAASGLTTGARGPWYVTVWDSVQIAGAAQDQAAQDEAAQDEAEQDEAEQDEATGESAGGADTERAGG